MTFGEKKRAFRTLHRIHKEMRDLHIRLGFRRIREASLTISQQDFEDCEWALCRVKTRIPEIDPETQEIIPGKGRLTRLNFLFYAPSMPQPNFLLKCSPVFMRVDPEFRLDEGL